MRRLGLLCVCAVAVLLLFSSPALAPTNTPIVDTDLESLSFGVGESQWGNGLHNWVKSPGTWDIDWDGSTYEWVDLGAGSGFYRLDDCAVTLRIRVTDGSPRTYEMTREAPGQPEEVYDFGNVIPN